MMFPRTTAISVTLLLLAGNASAQFTCKPQAGNGWVDPACKSPEIRKLVLQIDAAASRLKCEPRQRAELQEMRIAWGREQHECRVEENPAACAAPRLKAELDYLQGLKRCEVGSRPISFSSPEPGYVLAHPTTYLGATAAVLGQMKVDDCNPGGVSTSARVWDLAHRHGLAAEFVSLPDNAREFLCNKKPFSAWKGLVKAGADGAPYLYLTDVLGVEMPAREAAQP